MLQDNYLEEAFKMRNLLQELLSEPGVAAVQCCKGCKQRAPTILGVREHIFTGSVSSLAWFMSLQDSSFVTIGQRVLAWPLRCVTDPLHKALCTDARLSSSLQNLSTGPFTDHHAMGAV